DEFNYIDISACEEPKSSIEEVVTNSSKKQKLERRDGSKKRFRDSQINIAKTHPKAKNNFLVRSLLKLLICENLSLNLVSKESFYEFVYNLDSAFAILCEKL
ncbi:5261_t:CDS:2, partial [Cetraspora pellucida]